MNSTPIIAFSAWSGTGKTTLIEKLIIELKNRGLRLAVIKHDAHDFEIDKEGKDSWRFTRAGADVTAVSSGAKTAFVISRPLDLSDVVSTIRDVDMILAEGYNNEDLPSIGISRIQTGKGFRRPPESYIALVTDDPAYKGSCACVPVFGFEDIRAIADFIQDFISNDQCSSH